jgi:predicted nucleic acid-binding protein
MVLLIDSDVLIDYIAKRNPFFDNSYKIIELQREGLINGYISTQSILNIFFILRKTKSSADRREILRGLCDMFTLCVISIDMIIDSLEDNTFTDFEDCVQMRCAISVNADFIITRNTKDFTNSRIKAVTPAEFLELV